jgi:hypothetical protein
MNYKELQQKYDNLKEQILQSLHICLEDIFQNGKTIDLKNPIYYNLKIEDEWVVKYIILTEKSNKIKFVTLDKSIYTHIGFIYPVNVYDIEGAVFQDAQFFDSEILLLILKELEQDNFYID